MNLFNYLFDNSKISIKLQNTLNDLQNKIVLQKDYNLDTLKLCLNELKNTTNNINLETDLNKLYNFIKHRYSLDCIVYHQTYKNYYNTTLQINRIVSYFKTSSTIANLLLIRDYAENELKELDNLVNYHFELDNLVNIQNPNIDSTDAYINFLYLELLEWIILL